MNLHFSKATWNFVFKVIFIVTINTVTSATLWSQQNNVDSLSSLINKSRFKKDFSEQDSTHIKRLIKLGKYYRYVNSDSLLVVANKTLKLSTTVSYPNGIISAYSLHGDYYSDKGKSDTAIKNYEKALALISKQEIKNQNQKIDLLNSVASEYSYLGDYSKALSGYLNGIDLATEIDNKSQLSIMNENIANLYSSQKDYKQALDFYKKVTRINDEVGNEVFSAETYSNLALTYSHVKKFDQAMFNVNKSIAVFEKHEIFNWLAFAYEVKGRIYLDQKKYKWALYWYEQSNLIHDKIQDERGKIDMLNGLAKTYIGLQKDSIAATYAKEGFTIAKTINSLKGQEDCSKTLYQISKKKDDYANALLYHEVYNKLNDTLTRDDNQKSLSLLKAKLNYQKQKEQLIANNEKALTKQRGIIYFILGTLLILGAIICIIIRNQRIQKRLNKKLNHKTVIIQRREVELSKNNKTKNKLFSIIGHDLRGPIGALQELLRMFSEGEIKKNELDSFIPTLRADVDNVLFTLNNLLSWGQSQMNGSTTKPKSFTISNIVNRNIKLLSEMAHLKSIKLVSHVPDTIVAWGDLNQIDIVIRNLMSNALKFTPENGLISISALGKDDYWAVTIKDNGVGMTQDVQEKIFSDNSNITTYGTNNEKGTGLGLSLCKEMVEKNKGKIWVESSIHNGSTFYFTIPKTQKEYKEAV